MRTTFVLVWIVCLLILSGEGHRVHSQPMSANNPEDTQSIQCPAHLRAQPEPSNTPVFTSGVARPLFSSPFYLVTDPDALATRFGNRILVRDDILTAIQEKEHVQKTQGTFYYLGFRHNFENYYFETTNQSYPRVARFRVGLGHNGTYKPEEADFSHFRIRVRDSNGDDVLGFAAATGDEPLYDEGMMFALGWTDPYYFQRNLSTRDFMMGGVDAQIGANRPFSTIRRSNRHAEGPLPAVHQSQDAVWDEYFEPKPNESPGMDGFYVRRGTPLLLKNLKELAGSQYEAEMVNLGLTYTNLTETAWLNKKGQDPEPGRRLFALPPDQVYDFTPEVFAREEILTLEAWAENDQDQAISPVSSLTLGTQVRFQAEVGVLANNRFDYPNAQSSFGLIGYNFFYTWTDSNADPVQEVIKAYGPNVSTNLDFGGMVLDMVILEENQ